jgi:hypothetical protein
MEAPPFAGRYTPAPGFLAGWFTFLAGVLFPAFTIAYELITRICAQALFDPMPTLAHLAVISAVPALNLKLWVMRRREEPIGRGWLFAAGAALAVCLACSLLFLPIYPLAFVGILYFGLGLLPFAPLSAGLTMLVMTLGLARGCDQPFGKLLGGGLAAGLLVMLALDIPAAVTGVAVRNSMSSDPAVRERSVQLMRRFGSRELLLRHCYDHRGYTSGLLGLAMEGVYRLRADRDTNYRPVSTPRAARELYYRATGDTYDSIPPPWRGQGWRFTRNFAWDPDQGGAQVGGRLAGLWLASSRIDASMDADDAVAYLEWTAEFAEDSGAQREARLTLALPPGAVVTRATLWVNDVEREAVFAARDVVRAAYERVVMTRRDPLLVTTNGADRVLVQMFPVPPHGRAKIRIGMTAPLALSADDRATLAMPAIIDRNFSIDGALRHAVWVEGDGREAVADPGFVTLSSQDALVRRRGNFTDAELVARRPRVSLSRNPKAESVISGGVVQTILREPREPPGSFFVVLDGSVRARPARTALIEALDRIPLGARVGFAVASSTPALLPLSGWTPVRRRELLELLAAQPFDGGEDNLGALAQAMASLEGEPRGVVLWVHGPQGFEFDGHVAELEQLLARGASLPGLWLLPVSPGPNKVLRDPRLFADARTLAWSADPSADIGGAIADYFDTSPRWTIRRVPGSSQGMVTGSQHVEKLWAHEEVAQLLARGKRDEALALAGKHRLVTPASGAVVLESDDQYRAAGLTPPDASAVPTIPEPETWAMLIIACLAFAWALRHRRGMSA